MILKIMDINLHEKLIYFLCIAIPIHTIVSLHSSFVLQGSVYFLLFMCWAGTITIFPQVRYINNAKSHNKYSHNIPTNLTGTKHSCNGNRCQTDS
jgi:hypothetical protein